jgi:hypothetical protein
MVGEAAMNAKMGHKLSATIKFGFVTSLRDIALFGVLFF